VTSILNLPVMLSASELPPSRPRATGKFNINRRSPSAARASVPSEAGSVGLGVEASPGLRLRRLQVQVTGKPELSAAATVTVTGNRDLP
jgi:hypothetical protein